MGEPYLALQTEEIIGRRRELAAIDWALGVDDQTCVLMFIGPAGIGKTRLLNEADKRARERGLLSAGIIDLYHSDNHSNSGIERAIIRAVDPKEKHFRDYRSRRAEFERLRQEFAGKIRGAPELDTWRKNLTNIFIEDLTALSQERRILLIFDTAELIQFESDAVQSICQVEELSIEVREWLTTVIPRLRNVAVLLAGRGPQDDRQDSRGALWEDFRATFRGAQGKLFAWQEHPLDRFTESESLDYLRAVAGAARKAERECMAGGFEAEAGFLRSAASQIEQITPDVVSTIYRATEGRPVRLGWVVDLAIRGYGYDLFVPGEEDSRSSEELWAEIAPHIVKGIQELDLGYPVRDILHYLAVSRQGLDAELLRHLEPGWSLETCRERLAAMVPLSFVKTRPGTDLIFLHDDMYDLLERYLLRPIWEAFVGKYGSIAEYYERRLDQQESKEQRNDLEVKLLHYRLREKPRDGHQEYTRKSELAIKGHETGFDMRLRDEMLRFFADPWNQRLADTMGLSRDEIDRDSAVRWVKRHIARGDYGRAVEVAGTILHFGPEPYSSISPKLPVVDSIPPQLQQESRWLFGVADPLFWGHALTYYGESLLYHGVDPRAFRVLERAIGLLRGFEAGDNDRHWWRNRILARANNRLAYAYWMTRSYRMSVEHSQDAVHYYREANIPDEMAETLNNGAYIYALLWDIHRAEVWIEDALRLRSELGQDNPWAFSLNTRGLIHELAGEAYQARQCCQKALGIFKELGEKRGQIMACIGLGLAYRRMGNLWQGEVYSADEEEIEGSYRRAEQALDEAIHTFFEEKKSEEGKSMEQIRLVEAYDERGCLHRDWAVMLKSFGRGEEAEGHFKQARIDLERAVEQTKGEWPVQEADAREDMARLCLNMGERNRVEDYLRLAENLVPSEYLIREGLGFQEIKEPVEGFWQILGKVCMTRGDNTAAPVLGLDSLSEDQENLLLDAVWHYALAVAYFLRYSPGVKQHQGAFKAIYRALKRYGIPRLTKARQRVADVEERYRVDLSPLLEEMDKMLGLETR